MAVVLILLKARIMKVCLLKAFKDYYAGTPYIEKVNIKFNEGKADDEFINGKYDLSLLTTRKAERN